MMRASRVPGASRRRAVNLRMITLAGAVVLAFALPLAVASAGPAGQAGREKARAKSPAKAARGGSRELLRPAGDAEGAEDATGLDTVVGDAPADPGRGSVRCGPELASPEGLKAQTCVLEQARSSWARTYYRNATGGPLTGVLTLMAPDGRTLQTDCPMAASDDPKMCETPHEPTVRGHGSYAAVAEIASTEGNLLLRSGSNSPSPTAG